jgi:hypothetical protein
MADDDAERLQMFLAARGGRREALEAALPKYVAQLAEQVPAGASVVALSQIPDDPFPASNPLLRPYEALLEIELLGSGSGSADALLYAAREVVGELDDLVQLDLCTAVVGHPKHIAGEPNDSVVARYVYLMRRKAGTSHMDYLDVYGPHARFGHDIPGVTHYIQVHVDLDRSREAARALSMGAWQVDSVTELYIWSLEELFVPTKDRERLVQESYEDELRFVDRENSVQFCLAPIAAS